MDINTPSVFLGGLPQGCDGPVIGKSTTVEGDVAEADIGGGGEGVLQVGESDKPTALMADDNPDALKLLAYCLESHYQLEIAGNGQEGIDKALELVPDIIVTDVMMQEKDGFELCDTLKQDIRSSHIPIVMLTARADMQSKATGLPRLLGDVWHMPNGISQQEDSGLSRPFLSA